MLQITLSDKLAELQSNANVRALMASVKQDAQNETIDYTDTSRITVIWDKCDDKVNTRIAIIRFLNAVMYGVYELCPEYRLASPYKLSSTGPDLIWLYENHTRIQRLLVVSMFLESLNLRSFGVEPQWNDIPQSLLIISRAISYARRTFFDTFTERQANMVNNLPSEYIDLYTKTRPDKE